MNHSSWFSFRSCNLVLCLVANRNPQITVSFIAKLLESKKKVAGDYIAVYWIILDQHRKRKRSFPDFLIRLKLGTIYHLPMTVLDVSLHWRRTLTTGLLTRTQFQTDELLLRSKHESGNIFSFSRQNSASTLLASCLQLPSLLHHIPPLRGQNKWLLHLVQLRSTTVRPL